MEIDKSKLISEFAKIRTDIENSLLGDKEKSNILKKIDIEIKKILKKEKKEL